jgi:hypothetical protein
MADCACKQNRASSSAEPMETFVTESIVIIQVELDLMLLTEKPIEELE